MTTAGFVSATRDASTPSGCSRAAAAASLLLGGSLVVVLPTLLDSAFYVGVLAVAVAALAFAAGYGLWSRAGLVDRAAAGVAAGSSLLVQLTQILVGLPGAPGLSRVSLVESGLALGFAAAVLVFLTLDALRRRPEPAPDHPYAL